MFQLFNPPCGREHSRRLSGYLSVLAALFFTLLASSASAQVTHVTNPYVGATVYVSPDYATEVGTAIAAEPAGSTLAAQMSTVATYPTFVWLDHIGAIAGGTSNSGRLGLQAHINAALAQQKGTEPVVVQLVIYDLPDRDCAALASNGELSIAGGDTPIGSTTPLTGTGIQEYENDYITPIFNILAQYKTNPNVRFVLVIEDDSLPNMITNTGLSFALNNCIAANDGESSPTLSLNGVYVVGIQYALNQFHSLPNAYNYLDIGHHGWLGWPANAALAFPYFANVAKGTTAGFASVDGFITNTANYGPTVEPFMTAFTEPPGTTTGSGTLCASPEVCSGTFYQFNPNIDEATYATQFDAGFIAAGFPSTLGFLIDTSRNGWGGALRPTGPGTSAVIDTFVNETKIDERDDMGQWCNQANQGMGVPPTVNPGLFANLNAYVWVKPPGESDGNYPGSVFNGVTSTKGDPNCNPTSTNPLANNMEIGSIPNSPSAGTFWITEFVEDVQNAFPAIPVGSGFSIAATSASAVQGTTATSSVTVSEFGTFDGAVALNLSTLPTGVTAVLSPTSVTGSAGSTITFTVSATAVPGVYPLTVTGSGNGTTETAALNLTVVSAPNFTMTASSATISLPIGTNPTDTFTVTFVGGLTGSVSVSATGLPNGLQANFSPSSVNAPGGTIVANFSAQSSTPAGSYLIQIVGTTSGGAITHSVPITIVIPGTGFTLAPSASSLSVTRGSSGTDTITVTDLAGFTGSVSFTTSTLPSGVTASFSPASSTTSSVLTLTASSTATTGAFTVTVTGTSGSNTATTPITLSVVSGTGTFTLKPSAATLSIAQGASGTDTITVTDVSPFTGSVTFAATGQPSGVTASFSPASSATSSVVTFTVAATTVAGTYPITITGTSGSLSATTSISLTVTSVATGSFTLKPSAATLSIAQGASGTDTITVTDVSPFTGSVTFAATGQPSGVTASFSPASSTTSSVVTFTVAATTVAGTYPITITGTSGSLSATTSISLTVTGTSSSKCTVDYAITSQWPGGFGGALTIVNNGLTALTSWTLTWSFANGQTVTELWNGAETQSGANVTVTNLSYNGSIPAGGTLSGVGFNGSWNSVTNAIPTAISLNGTACTVN